jgi:hypothetical protein
VDRLIVEIEGIENKMKVEVVRPCKVKVEGIKNKSNVKVVRSGKVEFKDIDNKSKRSTDKRLTGGHVETN